jgi:hypothetical protein
MNLRMRSSSGARVFALGRCVGTLTLSGILLGVCAGTALAGTPAAFFNYSSVIGLNKSITATQVPIQTSTGAFIYKDVTIQFNVDAAGNLTYATTTPTATLAPTLSSANIRAGIYTDAENSGFGIQVSGPAPIGSGGEAQWSLTLATGLSCAPPQPATFYSGPSLVLADSALAARVKKAGITATQYSFGEVDGTSCGDGNWEQNALIGVTAIGSQLMVSSFTPPGATVDSTTPVETVVYNFEK